MFIIIQFLTQPISVKCCCGLATVISLLWEITSMKSHSVNCCTQFLGPSQMRDWVALSNGGEFLFQWNYILKKCTSCMSGLPLDQHASLACIYNEDISDQHIIHTAVDDFNIKSRIVMQPRLALSTTFNSYELEGQIYHVMSLGLRFTLNSLARRTK